MPDNGSPTMSEVGRGGGEVEECSPAGDGEEKS